MEHLLKDTAERAWRYRRSLHDRTVAPTPEALANLRRLDEPLPEASTDPEAVIAQLDELGSPATMASAGGRFFGFVVGSCLPATSIPGRSIPPRKSSRAPRTPAPGSTWTEPSGSGRRRPLPASTSGKASPTPIRGRRR